MGRRQLRTTITAVTVMLSSLVIAWVAAQASTEHRADEPAATGEDVLVLTGDVTPEIRKLAAAVVDAARFHEVGVVATELEIRFVDRVEPDAFVGGRTDGEQILVGRNVARPDLTLLHEISHAVVGIEYGHDEPWRSVYVTAVSEVFGDRRATRELRRIEWVYDKSYLDSHEPAGPSRSGPRDRLEPASYGRGGSRGMSAEVGTPDPVRYPVRQASIALASSIHPVNGRSKPSSPVMLPTMGSARASSSNVALRRAASSSMVAMVVVADRPRNGVTTAGSGDDDAANRIEVAGANARAG